MEVQTEPLPFSPHQQQELQYQQIGLPSLNRGERTLDSGKRLILPGNIRLIYPSPTYPESTPNSTLIIIIVLPFCVIFGLIYCGKNLK